MTKNDVILQQEVYLQMSLNNILLRYKTNEKTLAETRAEVYHFVRNTTIKELREDS